MFPLSSLLATIEVTSTLNLLSDANESTNCLDYLMTKTSLFALLWEIIRKYSTTVTESGEYSSTTLITALRILKLGFGKIFLEKYENPSESTIQLWRRISNICTELQVWSMLEGLVSVGTLGMHIRCEAESLYALKCLVANIK